jgi:uncharacterized protein (DUF427 family)|uniref:hypothetical protein n=1 Tax=Nocardia abscessus TaxID=120957 RepID=UPI0018950918|nr:hypothetical protein [Nocardia abscessus]
MGEVGMDGLGGREQLRQQVLLVPLSRAEGLSTVCPFKGVATYRHCDGDGVNR